VTTNPLSIPASLGEISTEWLTAAFRSTGRIKDSVVVSLDLQPVDAGRGLSGQAARLRLGYDRDEPGAPSTVFAKLSPESPEVRQQLRGIGHFETEAGFYQDLAGSDSFPVRVPRPYLSIYDHATNASALLIEDLGDARFGDSVAGSSPDDARLIVTQLARLHAHYWEHPSLKGLSWLRSPADVADATGALYQAMLPRFEQVWASRAPAELTECARAFSSSLAASLRLASLAPCTLAHTDTRLDNFAFPLVPESGVLIIFDWQLARFARGTSDLAYFLAQSLPIELRRSMETELLSLYLDTLVANGVTGYSSDDLELDYRRGLSSPLRVAVMAGALLDFSSERGTELWLQFAERVAAALADHSFDTALEELFPA
jgi:hypothetical protein